jgi:hypothetical protein
MVLNVLTLPNILAISILVTCSLVNSCLGSNPSTRSPPISLKIEQLTIYNQPNPILDIPYQYPALIFSPCLPCPWLVPTTCSSYVSYINPCLINKQNLKSQFIKHTNH